MSIDTVLQIARQLHAEGKQPSVALIKARLPAPCPMPDVISGIQRWRQQSTSGTDAGSSVVAALSANPEQPSDPLQLEVQQLREEVSQLREEIVMLRRSIRQLAEQRG